MAKTDQIKLELDSKRYDNACQAVRDTLGSFESIAGQCSARTGNYVCGNSIRNWMLNRTIPIKYAVIFQELTFGEVDVFDFFPWLKHYV